MSKSNLFACLVIAASVLAAGCSGGDDDDDGMSMPDAPTGLTTAVMGSAAHLQWTDVSGEDEFMIERRLDAGAYSTVDTVPFDTVQYMDMTVESGMTYTFRISAMNDAGMSDPSNESTITMP